MTPIAPPPGPATQGPHDAPEVEGTTPPLYNSAAIVGGAVGGVLGVVLLLLVLYLLTLRRRLSKAMDQGRDGAYQVRVEDVVHLAHLDHSNTYLNTTDLHRLVCSVRAATKTLPTPPRIHHQTPTPYRPPPTTHNGGCASDVVVVRAPMPLPSPAARGTPPRHPQQEAVYSNVGEVLAPLAHAPSTAPPLAHAPSTAPPLAHAPSTAPPLPCGEGASCPDVGLASPARPAPPPPSTLKADPGWKPTPPENPKPTPPENPKPTPPENPKPTPPENPKPTPPENPKPTPPENLKPRPPPNPKPTPPESAKPRPPPVASKPSRGVAPPPSPLQGGAGQPRPGLRGKGRGLPPLKVPLLPPRWREDTSSCSSTPDTSLTYLTPDTTTGQPQHSILAKVAKLEAKLMTSTST
ncbi:uncharacterized protein [Panulirus ornatus]